MCTLVLSFLGLSILLLDVERCGRTLHDFLYGLVLNYWCEIMLRRNSRNLVRTFFPFLCLFWYSFAMSPYRTSRCHTHMTLIMWQQNEQNGFLVRKLEHCVIFLLTYFFLKITAWQIRYWIPLKQFTSSFVF